MSTLSIDGNVQISRPTVHEALQPPAAIQCLIESIAAYVAQHGPASEFQLRTRDKSRCQYPFLWLDNQHAPFYQRALAAARRNLEVFTSSASVTATRTEQDDENCPENQTLPRAAVHDAVVPSSPLMDPEDLALLYKFTYGKDIETDLPQDANENQTGLPELQTGSSADSALPQTGQENAQPSEQSQREQSAITISSSSDHSSWSPESGPQRYIPYGLLQEVHLLDSSGTERSGLNTYIVISNSSEEVNEPLLKYLYDDTQDIRDEEPFYRLRPDIQTVFRASHRRLLPVGFPLGAEVQQKDNILPSIIVRRTVKHGERQYDVKDAIGELHKDVPEEDLELHRGGIFDFRNPG